METDFGKLTHTLDQLARHPENFEFFQAVLIIERAKNKIKLGHSGLFDHHQLIHKWIKFRSNNSFSFPSSVIQAYQKDVSILSTNILTLTGMDNILPENYNESLLHELHHKKNTLHDFLDLFYHRLVTLFYFSWEKSRIYIDYGRTLRNKKSQRRFNYFLTAFIGAPQRFIFDERLLFYSGFLSKSIKSAQQLTIVLNDFFNQEIQLIPFQGHWIELDKRECSALSIHHDKFNLLGKNCLLGKRIWHLQSHCYIQIGPLSFTEFNLWLPHQSNLKILKKFLKLCISVEIKISIKLVLKQNEIPVAQLRLNRPLQLGWNTWLKTAPLSHDVIIIFPLI